MENNIIENNIEENNTNKPNKSRMIKLVALLVIAVAVTIFVTIKMTAEANKYNGKYYLTKSGHNSDISTGGWNSTEATEYIEIKGDKATLYIRNSKGDWEKAKNNITSYSIDDSTIDIEYEDDSNVRGTYNEDEEMIVINNKIYEKD